MRVNLSEFLLARIVEDKVRAERTDEHYAPFEREWEWCPRARPEPLGDLPGGPDAACECNCPQAKRRALAECEAKRRIVELAPWADNAHHAALKMPPGQQILRALAQPYADHPDFDPEWRP